MSFVPVAPDGLPIYRDNTPCYVLFYTPGYLCVVPPEEADGFQQSLNAPGGAGQSLVRHAHEVIQAAGSLHTQYFEPECLTLYMNNTCNLNCTYCFTDTPSRTQMHLSLDEIGAAARVVAENCRAKGLPLTTVLHGGGEPLLDQCQVDETLHLLDHLAGEFGLVQFRYVATNGVMPVAKAEWMARHFDLVGLSCDGPPDIQNRQRPSRRNNAPTSHTIEQTAAVLRQAGRAFHARATITPEAVTRQEEIIDYIGRVLRPHAVHFEPVYTGGRADAETTFAADTAETFVTHFLQAQALARRYNLLLTTSGSRLSTLHGPYCNVFRQVLNIVPGGVATACFKVTDAQAVRKQQVEMGHYDHDANVYQIDHPRIAQLQAALSVYPEHCRDCFNRFHCVKSCPDSCPTPSTQAAMRCAIQKKLAYTELHRHAESYRGGELWEIRLADL